ncbi:MAG: hypothetical protein HY966_04710, partial [Ignavibacteriales bacterium]|nr:hypothetical protein [Ignavibacteriales bacterium]
MKKILVVSLMLVLVATSGAFAQKKFSENNYAGINPLGLLFKIYSGEYGRFINNGAAEINVPFFYWAPTTDLTILGLGGSYRMYKDGNGEGIFYGGGLQFLSISWNYTSAEKITG